MELFALEWWLALATIIAIDLVLAGDNAVVIAMAADTLPKRMQKRAVIYGTGGAILVRVVFSVFAVYLLTIPYLKAVGGLLLFWIAYKLVAGKNTSSKHDMANVNSFAHAMMLIVVADAVMGIDNIIAIAGAAKGDVPLVVIGLLVSIPIVMYGSFFILSMIKRHPWIIWVGGALLGYVGGEMIVSDVKMAEAYFDDNMVQAYTLRFLAAALMFGLGWWFHRRSSGGRPAQA